MRRATCCVCLSLCIGVALTLCGCGGSEELASEPSTQEPQSPKQRPAAKVPIASKDQLLVDREQLEAMLGAEDTVILDTRPSDDYQLGHVPGAVRVDPIAWRKHSHESGGLSDVAYWSSEIGGLGIDANTSVVVYGRSLSSAARVWWHLKFAGVQSVALLDGGWALWKAGGKPEEMGANTPVSVAFTPQFQTDLLATKEDVAAALDLPSVAIVDARSLEEYEGKGQPRGGHLRGAVHLEWKELLDVNGRVKSKEELRKLFAQRGLDEEQTVIAHCMSGGRSSMEALALQLAGFQDVKNYYCGWIEWSQPEESPEEAEEDEQQ